MTGKNLTNQRFGRLVALRPTGRRAGSNIVWECECDCGNLTETAATRLIGGHTKSCGCLVRENAVKVGHANALDIRGEKFGKLLALHPTGSNKQKRIIWKCICDCGNYTLVTSSNLKSGAVQSCGCLVAEVARTRYITNHPNWQGGVETENKKIRKSPQYKRWRHQVFGRDCFTCQVCGQSGRGIVAHHLKDFSTHPDLRFCAANGVTLCSKCHIEFHKQYGYSCDTFDFQEFLGRKGNV